MARHMIRSTPSIHPSIHPLICPSSPYSSMSVLQPVTPHACVAIAMAKKWCLKTSQIDKNQAPRPRKSQKSLQNRSKNDTKIPNAFQRRPETVFSRFFAILGGPGASPNRTKIAKIRKKTLKNQRQKKTYFWTPFFIDFSPFWPPKMDPKSSFFRIFCEKRRFGEN